MAGPEFPAKKPAGIASSDSAATPVTVLLIGSGPVTGQLRRILGHSCWRVLDCEGVEQAAAILPTLGPAVVLTHAALADGTWKDVLALASTVPAPPPVIVAVSYADDSLWMEVLNLGGYNLLGEPFNEQEVFRILSTAWLKQKNRAQTARRFAAI